MFGGGEFGESSVIRQTLTSQILAGNSTLWLKSIHSPNFILPITFNLVIRQTLTPPNIPAAILYCIITTQHFNTKYSVSNASHTVYWEIFEAQNFRGLAILKFFANKFLRMAIKARSSQVHAFKFSRLQEKSAKTYKSEHSSRHI